MVCFPCLCCLFLYTACDWCVGIVWYVFPVCVVSFVAKLVIGVWELYGMFSLFVLSIFIHSM